jgi:hypothetical protein
MLSPSRAVSLLLLAAAYARLGALTQSRGGTLAVLPLLVLSWSPAEIDDYTFGLW